MKQYLQLIRVKHYIKNLLLFLPLVCSGELLDWSKSAHTIIGFAVFCAVSSAVYIINDIRDLAYDRQHPTKKMRPLASGQISVRAAGIVAAVLGGIGILCNAVFLPVTSLVCLVVYFLINVLYSIVLKNYPIVDISILASGFILRILYGAIIADISVSNWLYLTVFCMSLYFALGKRRNEAKAASSDNTTTRKVLKQYTTVFLNNSMYMFLGLANVFYALWSMDEKTIAHYHGTSMILTVPVVFLITLRYTFDIEGDSDGDPVEVLLHDKWLLILCMVYLAIMMGLLYFGNI